jgi:dihydroxyacetone kinase
VLLSSFNKIDRINYSMLDVQCSMFDVHQYLFRLEVAAMTDSSVIRFQQIVAALERVAVALNDRQEYLTELDQAMGDGDLGITASKISVALKEYAAATTGEDLGKYLAAAGMAINRAAPSTMGTLLATALMKVGKETRGLSEFNEKNLAAVVEAADRGIQERGKAKPGDKTIVDALHPAAETFKQAIEEGVDLKEAGERMLAAAEKGLNDVTPLQSRIGRASWVGERTKGQVDPGCAFFVAILKAILKT